MADFASLQARYASNASSSSSGGLASGRLPSPKASAAAAAAAASPPPPIGQEQPPKQPQKMSYAELMAQMKSSPSIGAPSQTSAGNDQGVLKVLLKGTITACIAELMACNRICC